MKTIERIVGDLAQQLFAGQDGQFDIYRDRSGRLWLRRTYFGGGEICALRQPPQLCGDGSTLTDKQWHTACSVAVTS